MPANIRLLTQRPATEPVGELIHFYEHFRWARIGPGLDVDVLQKPLHDLIGTLPVDPLSRSGVTVRKSIYENEPRERNAVVRETTALGQATLVTHACYELVKLLR